MIQNALMGNYRSDPLNDYRIAFWSDQTTWPQDTTEHTFLGRAVLAMGRKAYGNAWADDCSTTRLIWPLRGELSLYTPTADTTRALALLQQHSPTFREKFGLGLLSKSSNHVFPTVDEWREARKFSEIQSTLSLNKFHGFPSQTNRLADALKDGHVISATRPHAGGEITARPSHFWNYERRWLRFETCRVDPNDYFGNSPFGGDGLWLFVETTSFEKWLNETPSGNTGADPDPEIMAELKERRPSGRPAKTSWDAIIAEFTRIVHSEGTDGNVSALSERLWEWAAENLDDPPNSKTIAKSLRVWLRDIPINTR